MYWLLLTSYSHIKTEEDYESFNRINSEKFNVFSLDLNSGLIETLFFLSLYHTLID
jgi:hypothetical protein